MNFLEATKSGFTKYVVFNKRSSRSEFWYFNLAIALINLFILWIEFLTGMIDFEEGFDESGPLSNLFAIITILPLISVASRRLQDRGHSGWNQLWVFTIIGVIPLIILFMLPAKEDENKWGRNPLLD